jgi:hypothetical protein
MPFVCKIERRFLFCEKELNYEIYKNHTKTYENKNENHLKYYFRAFS